MPSKDLHFSVKSGLKNIIGSDLISDDFIAVFELVKNSFDAYAKEVTIIFENDKISIKDDGKGMDFQDIEKKWLSVAYSAKKGGEEDIELGGKEYSDYRSKIIPAKYYAGAKGIGRFSCDRIGAGLILVTKKVGKNSRVEQLKIDWGKFDIDPKEKFENVRIKYIDPPDKSYLKDFKHGTLLEITSLRSPWKRTKILDLKHSLEKLINPFDILDKSRKGTTAQQKRKFSIQIISEVDENKDATRNFPREKVNGPVQNFIFETLGLKTTQIFTEVSEDGKKITSELIDRGELIYKIVEESPYSTKLSNIKLHLFYLNQSAKINFKRLMGISSVEFGSVFLYKNGFRVYPFGEQGEDSFGIDRRKQQGYNRYLGTREIVGRIEIYGNEDDFRETSSRDGGLKKTSGYFELENCFVEKCLKKLEKYVVGVQWALNDKEESLEKVSSLQGREKIINLISTLADSKNVKLLDYNKNLLNILKDKFQDPTLEVFEGLSSIAIKSGDKIFSREIAKAKRKYINERNAREKAVKQLDEISTENLFLKSLKTREYDELLSLHHQIGISSETIESYLKTIIKQIQTEEEIPQRKLLDYVQKISFENKKITTVAKFATRANFKLEAITKENNIVEYLTEYIINIVKPSLTYYKAEIRIFKDEKLEFVCRYRPIELSIIIDNLISNSRKSGATFIDISFLKLDRNNLQVIFKDNGIGIPKENRNRIFDFGFTTTGGSGIGLFHVKNILNKLKWEISVDNKFSKGTKFILIIKNNTYEQK